MWGEPVSIVLGLRHKKIFHFLDLSGEIIDALFDLQETGQIPEGSFDGVEWGKITSHIRGPKDALRIDLGIDGIIMTVDLRQTRISRDELKNHFLLFVNTACEITGGNEVVDRIGVVEHYELAHDTNADAGRVAVENLTTLGALGTDLGDPADFGMRVALRTATETAMAGTTKDWRNTIIQIANRKPGRQADDVEGGEILRASIDVQLYFDPERPLNSRLIEDHLAYAERRRCQVQGALPGLVHLDAAAR
jgi:hypothetical protein